PMQESGGIWCDPDLTGLVAELLSADRGLKHEAGLIHGEYGDAIDELGIGACAGFERHGGGLRVETEVAVLKTFHGGGVLEDQNFGVGLPAELGADRSLGHVAVADHRA